MKAESTEGKRNFTSPAVALAMHGPPGAKAAVTNLTPRSLGHTGLVDSKEGEYLTCPIF